MNSKNTKKTSKYEQPLAKNKTQVVDSGVHIDNGQIDWSLYLNTKYVLYLVGGILAFVALLAISAKLKNQSKGVARVQNQSTTKHQQNFLGSNKATSHGSQYMNAPPNLEQFVADEPLNVRPKQNRHLLSPPSKLPQANMKECGAKSGKRDDISSAKHRIENEQPLPKPKSDSKKQQPNNDGSAPPPKPIASKDALQKPNKLSLVEPTASRIWDGAFAPIKVKLFKYPGTKSCTTLSSCVLDFINFFRCENFINSNHIIGLSDDAFKNVQNAYTTMCKSKKISKSLSRFPFSVLAFQIYETIIKEKIQPCAIQMEKLYGFPFYSYKQGDEAKKKEGCGVLNVALKLLKHVEMDKELYDKVVNNMAVPLIHWLLQEHGEKEGVVSFIESLGYYPFWLIDSSSRSWAKNMLTFAHQVFGQPKEKDRHVHIPGIFESQEAVHAGSFPIETVPIQAWIKSVVVQIPNRYVDLRYQLQYNVMDLQAFKQIINPALKLIRHLKRLEAYDPSELLKSIGTVLEGSEPLWQPELLIELVRKMLEPYREARLNACSKDSACKSAINAYFNYLKKNIFPKINGELGAADSLKCTMFKLFLPADKLPKSDVSIDDLIPKLEKKLYKYIEAEKYDVACMLFRRIEEAVSNGSLDNSWEKIVQNISDRSQKDKNPDSHRKYALFPENCNK